MKQKIMDRINRQIMYKSTNLSICINKINYIDKSYYPYGKIIDINNPYNIIPNRYIVYDNGNIFDLKLNRYIKFHNDNGYLRCSLCTTNSIKSFRVHRIIAMIYCYNPYNDYSSKIEVNHINGIKTDNYASNLEWCTSSENSIHALKLLMGNSNRYKYSEGFIRKICKILERNEYKSYNDILNELGYEENNKEIILLINQIKRNKIYKFISKDYNIDRNKKIYKFSNEYIIEVAKLISIGKSSKEISDIMNIDFTKSFIQFVSDIKHKKYYKSIIDNIMH